MNGGRSLQSCQRARDKEENTANGPIFVNQGLREY